MLDATYNDPDVEIVEEENGVPSIILIFREKWFFFNL